MRFVHFYYFSKSLNINFFQTNSKEWQMMSQKFIHESLENKFLRTVEVFA